MITNPSFSTRRASLSLIIIVSTFSASSVSTLAIGLPFDCEKVKCPLLLS
jgi:hypothetical protein